MCGNPIKSSAPPPPAPPPPPPPPEAPIPTPEGTRRRANAAIARGRQNLLFPETGTAGVDQTATGGGSNLLFGG